MLLPHLLPPYYLGLAVQMLVFALFAMSLDLLIGYGGMASLGHAAYFGVAAYATGLLALRLHWDVWLALPAGLLAAALTAVLFGLLALRTRGSYFLMITLALSQVLWGVAFGWRSLTGGDDGLPEVPRPDLGLPSLARCAPTASRSIISCCSSSRSARCCWSASSTRRSAMRSAASARAKPGCWRSATTSGATSSRRSCWPAPSPAWPAASMSTSTASSVPTTLHVTRSAEVLLMVILGGAGTLIGPAIGAALIVLLQNVVSGYTERWLIVIGTIYILVALFAPDGLIGLIRRLRRRTP